MHLVLPADWLSLSSNRRGKLKSLSLMTRLWYFQYHSKKIRYLLISEKLEILVSDTYSTKEGSRVDGNGNLPTSGIRTLWNYTRPILLNGSENGCLFKSPAAYCSRNLSMQMISVSPQRLELVWNPRFHTKTVIICLESRLGDLSKSIEGVVALRLLNRESRWIALLDFSSLSALKRYTETKHAVP